MDGWLGGLGVIIFHTKNQLYTILIPMTRLYDGPSLPLDPHESLNMAIEFFNKIK